MTVPIIPFITFTIGIIVLFIGKIITMRSPLLQKYSIPDPVIGGFLCAIIVFLLYVFLNIEVVFDMEDRDMLLLYFFAAVGLRAKFSDLIAGGKPLAILLLLATVFIALQNVTGITVATLFGLDYRLGVVAGSMSLTGGIGTTVAWAPIFTERFELANTEEIGFACNTAGLIAACCIGGPIANFLINRHKLETGSHEGLDMGVAHDRPQESIDYLAFLFAFLAISLSIILGYAGINPLFELAGLQMPLFVSCLIGGIIIGNLVPKYLPWLTWPGSDRGLGLISDISLGMFLTMALMGMSLAAIGPVLGFVIVLIIAQASLSILYTLFVVFRSMGGDYEAAVISAGFGGITLGSTATAIVNMTAVTQQYGAARQAFIVVPLVCGFFIDLVNSLMITFFSSF